MVCFKMNSVSHLKRFISNMQSFVAAWHMLLWSSVIYLRPTVENGPDHIVKDNGMLNCKRKCCVKKWAYSKIALEFLSSSESFDVVRICDIRTNTYKMFSLLVVEHKKHKLERHLFAAVAPWEDNAKTILEWLHPGTAQSAHSNRDQDTK